MPSGNKIRVAIDFRVDDPRQGVGTAVLALAHGLSQLCDTDQEYVFVVREKNHAWLQPHVSGPCSVVAAPEPARGGRPFPLRNKLRSFERLRKLWLGFRGTAALVPRSDGFLEQLGCDLVHFPSQAACLTELPNIYQPWDLQHRHHPEFFPPGDILLRDATYQAFCQQARYVCIQTEWGKQDLVHQFGIDPGKIVVIRWGTAFEAYIPPSQSEVDMVRQQLNLSADFFLYPAVTWPHKNHELILKALDELNRKGIRRHIIFTGASGPHRKHLDATIQQLGLETQVRFLGFVNHSQLQALYRLATAMIFPSKFEGLGLPVLEAFRVGLPVLCSSATVLPEVTDSAALLFDPDSPAALVEAMQRVESPEVRGQLAARGKSVLLRYSIQTAAEQFAALYRETAAKEESRA